MTEFFSWFRSEIDLLTQHVQRLAADRRLLSASTHLSELTARFPDDPKAFSWVTSDYYAGWELRNALVALKYRFSIMRLRPFSMIQVQWRLGLYWQCHTLSLADYIRLFNTASTQIVTVSQKFNAFNRDPILRNAYNYDPVITPLALMAWGEPVLRAAAGRMTTISFHPETLTDLPPVRCPFRILQILRSTVHLMKLRQFSATHIYVTTTVDKAFLSLIVSSPNVQIRPDNWDFMERGLSGSGEIHDYFEQSGGRIEPLTWDEGYGQGVIFRLTWAKETP